MSTLLNTAPQGLKNQIEDMADDVELPDDAWMDSLTPFEAPAAPAPVAQPAAQQPSAQGTDEQRQRLAEVLGSMEHVDAETAEELYTKVVKPAVSGLEEEVVRLRRERDEEFNARRSRTLNEVNAVLQGKYPKAANILRSREFMDFVNSNTSPYATETNFDILSRAYYAGDAEYVLKRIDEFVDARGKPKPTVGVEVPRGSGGAVDVKAKSRGMTEEEYRAKRAAIRSAPPGTYPPNALAVLADEFMKGRA